MSISQGVRSAPPPNRPTTATVENDRIAQWIADLASDSFTSRTLSQSRLVDLAARDVEQADHIRRLLRDNPDPPADLELYLAKRRLLGVLDRKAREIEIDRFLHDPSFDHQAVVGWTQFRRHAGDGLDARLLYADTIRVFPGYGLRLQHPADPPRLLPDFDAVDRQDAVAWSMMLTTACQQVATLDDRETMRLTATLRSTGTGPMPQREHERRVIARLISSYLTRATIDIRDRMEIGLRYQCREIVEADCRRVLGDPTQSPSRIVTALLAASALDESPPEIDDWLQRFGKDPRVSHVWRSMNPPKTTHRTQVRDVALALELHRSGIDPRTRGFAALVADPILVFRPYSLGFESEESRRRTHANR
jgi:hypothetical protein